MALNDKSRRSAKNIAFWLVITALFAFVPYSFAEGRDWHRSVREILTILALIVVYSGIRFSYFGTRAKMKARRAPPS